MTQFHKNNYLKYFVMFRRFYKNMNYSSIYQKKNNNNNYCDK